MPVHNTDIAAIFNEMADLLEIEGANPFRVRAYRAAADTITHLPRQIRDMVAGEADLTELEGIGEDLAGKIEEIVRTGRLKQLRELEKHTPPDLAELMHLPGLGPKRIKQLHEELGIASRQALKQAAEQGRIHELPGFGKKLEAQILEGIASFSQPHRTLLYIAEEVATSLLAYLGTCDAIEKAEVAGSYRRRKETVGDLDIVAISAKPKQAMDHFVKYEDVARIISKGETRSSIVLKSDLQVDLRVMKRESYGAALLYFTGSKAHNIHLRDMALSQGSKINEYGVFKGKKRLGGETEEEIYGLFGMPFIEPELRENRGEIEAALKKDLPDLITEEDIVGDLHAHTHDSDGRNSLEEMARAAIDRGYAYLAITDHSPALAVTRGLDARALRRQIDAIDKLNDTLKDFRLLKGIEVDILEDGTLDLPNDVLKLLDVRVGSIHSKFNLSQERQTARILRAMDNPYFQILGHPTGRLLGKREPYAIDLERILHAALERGCFLEINAQPLRLDLSDDAVKRAKEIGVKLAISTDAHAVSELPWMRFGVGQARRGWLEAGDALNTQSCASLLKTLKRT